jgi:UDP-GlcNAc:undecaprenyl-phosphate GlcNAc-1-phosphate transferase
MLILFTGLLSVLLTRLQIRAASRLGLMAAPRTDRWHAVTTPSSGGLAIFLSCAAAYWLACPGRYPRIAWAVAALWIFGFLDDRLRLGPARKLAVQVAAAGFVVMGGVVFPATPWYLPNVALSMFWIVMITNAFNLIDNMDGLCAGVVIIICLFRSWLLTSEGYHADADLCAILAAAFAGFLFFNYHPARIFMGDCGSLPAGFALAALTLAGPAPHKGLLLTGFFYPALTFAYPIFDTAPRPHLPPPGIARSGPAASRLDSLVADSVWVQLGDSGSLDAGRPVRGWWITPGPTRYVRTVSGNHAGLSAAGVDSVTPLAHRLPRPAFA